MAIKKTIEIDVNASDAEKDVKKLTSQFEDLGKTATKSINNIEKSTEDTEKSTKSLAHQRQTSLYNPFFGFSH